ncbi:hypothetical protein BDV18DRAFT_130122 [Aspergillus unguis]
MHFPLKTLTLLGGLTLTLANDEKDLGYLKCASAVVKTTTFPTCTSSYKLDCFCEASARLNKSKSILVSAVPSGSAWSGSGAQSERPHGPARARVQLAPEVEEICVENGVPRDEIDRYLCDDGVVPASPRRGSTPMGRIESKDRDGRDGSDGLENDKRGISFDETRLLIPENGADADAAGTEGPKHEDQDRNATPEDIYEVVTVTITHTKTECSCAKTPEAGKVHGTPSSVFAEASPTPTPSRSLEDDDDEDDDSTMSGAMHGTQIAVAIMPSPPSSSELGTGFGSESESVRVASSSVAPAPTGVDAHNEHGLTQGDDMFEGGAGINGISSTVVIGVLGIVAAAFVL